jgi:protein TonB
MRTRNLNPLFFTLSLSVFIHGGVLWLVSEGPRQIRPDKNHALPVSILPAVPPPESPPLTAPPEIPPPIRETVAPAEAALPAETAAPAAEAAVSTETPLPSPEAPSGQQGLSVPVSAPFIRPELREDAVNRYAAMIRSLIDKRKEYPYQARRQDQEGSVQIRFTLSRRGALTGDPVAEKNSRHRLFNESALKAVKDAAPYPPFPEEIADEEMSFQVTVSFSL